MHDVAPSGAVRRFVLGTTLAGALAGVSHVASAAERVPLEYFFGMPPVLSCTVVQAGPKATCVEVTFAGLGPDCAADCPSGKLCKSIDQPAFTQCSQLSNGLLYGDWMSISSECCAPADKVAVVLQVADVVTSTKTIRVGTNTQQVTGRGQNPPPNVAEMRTSPVEVTPSGGDFVVLGKNNQDAYQVPFSDFAPYAGRVVVFRWVRDDGGAPPQIDSRYAKPSGEPLDGSVFIETTSGKLWVVFAGVKFPLADAATVNRIYPNRLIYQIPALSAPSVPPDGTLLREESGKTWAVVGKAKFLAPDSATSDRLFPDVTPFSIGNGGAARIPDVPYDGTLIREEGGSIWAVLGGARFALPDPDTLERSFPGKPVAQLWNGAAAGLPTLPRDGSVFRDARGSANLIAGGAKLAVPDTTTFRHTFGTRPPFPTWDGALSGIPIVPRDGTALRDDAGTLRILIAHGMFQLPDVATYARLFGRPVTQVWTGAPSAIPTAPADGTLFSEGTTRYAVVLAGAKFVAADLQTVIRHYPAQPIPLWNGALASLSNVPTDGALFREDSGAGDIYVVYAGAKFRFPDPWILTRLFSGKMVYAIWSGALTPISDVPADGTILREENGLTWVIIRNTKFFVPDAATLARLFPGRPVYQLWTGAVTRFDSLPPDGTLLRDEDGAVWVVYGGAKFHVPDPATLARLFSGQPVFQLWNAAVNFIPNLPRSGTCLGEEGDPPVVSQMQGSCKVSKSAVILHIDQNGHKTWSYDPSCHMLWADALSSIPDCP